MQEVDSLNDALRASEAADDARLSALQREVATLAA